MEAHPIPQNVTNFEFHLIGDMTLKQFGYLAGGVGTAYVIFITLSGLIPLIAYPLIVILSILGVAFAFLPIMERPLDHWVAAYFRAIFKPTIRTWRFKAQTNKDQLFLNRLGVYMASLDRAIYREQKSSLPSPKLSFLSQLAPATQQVVQTSLASSPIEQTSIAPAVSPPLPAAVAATASPPPSAPAKMPTSEELEDTVALAKKAQIVQAKIVETEELLNQLKARASVPGTDPNSFAKESQAILSQLQQLTTEASKISAQITGVTNNAPAPLPIKEVIPAIKKQVQTNIVLTSVPNIINGIVTDALNNYMEGVIVVTHDKQGLPVRALKTNKLGQFVAATPLPNGGYTLSLEKDNLVFDSVSISLDGQVLAPMVVAAKRGGPS